MKLNLSSPQATAEFLPSADQDRLARILDDYLTALENGAPVSPEELLQRYPNDAEQLRGYLSGLEVFHRAAAAPRGAGFSGNLEGNSPIPPRIIGDFRLVQEIGRGGMGVVYEAWQMSLRRLVAIKILPVAAAHDAKQLSRFRNEAQAAAQVQHPNIVPVYAVGEDDGTPYYAMQLIPGRCLAMVLSELRSGAKSVAGPTVANRGSTQDCEHVETVPDSGWHTAADRRPVMNATETAAHVRAVARLGVQAAEALHAAHEYGVVHRDVKPSNLLVEDSGKLWVTDFGLARCRENADLTQTGDVLGTMRYMSPEQARGRTTLIDHRTDVYSLGVTLYELATLVHPAESVSDLQLYFDRSRPTIKPLRHWNGQLPVDFQTIVMKALSEFPSERYNTARELANDLERFLAGKPILATPPSPATRFSKWAKRHRRALAAAMLAAFVGLVIHTLLLTQERAARELALARSVQSLDHAHRVLDRFGSRLVDQLAAIPGAEGVRHELLQDSLHLYRQFERQARDDGTLASDLAFAYGRMGSLAERMGDMKQAAELHTKARDIWKDRASDEPDNREHIRNLALNESNLGMLFATAGRAADGLKLLQQARHRQERLASLDSSAYTSELAATHSNLGHVLSQLGDREHAIKELKEAVALQEWLVRTSLGNESVLRGLSVSYNRLGSVLTTIDPPATAAIYRKSIAVQWQLVNAEPINRLLQGDLARTYTNLGILLCGSKDWRNAERCYTDAVRIQENLVNASPLAATYRRDLAISYNNLGMMQSRNGKLQEAESSFRKAEQLQRRLLAEQSGDSQLLSNLGSVLNNLGLLLGRMEDLDNAESTFREAIQFQKRALDASPKNAQVRELLSRCHFYYAQKLRGQKKFNLAVESARERRSLWPGQAERLFSVAQELADTHREMSKESSIDAESKDNCVRAAVETLREALAAGLPAERLQLPAFSSFTDHEAYRTLLAEAKRGDPSPPATHQAQLPDERRVD